MMKKDSVPTGPPHKKRGRKPKNTQIIEKRGRKKMKFRKVYEDV